MPVEPIAVVFPGQGSQRPGMGRDFFERYSVARDAFAEANDALGLDLGAICSMKTRASTGPVHAARLFQGEPQYKTHLERFGHPSNPATKTSARSGPPTSLIGII